MVLRCFFYFILSLSLTACDKPSAPLPSPAPAMPAPKAPAKPKLAPLDLSLKQSAYQSQPNVSHKKVLPDFFQTPKAQKKAFSVDGKVFLDTDPETTSKGLQRLKGGQLSIELQTP